MYSAILSTTVQLNDGITIYGFPKEVTLFRVQGAGFKAVTRIPLLVWPLALGRLVQKRLVSPIVRLAVELGWNIAGNTILRSPGTNFNRWGVQLAVVADFDESFDAIWAKVANKYEVTVTGDRAFLHWRFRSALFRSYPILVA
jgi:hypothetical protein